MEIAGYYKGFCSLENLVRNLPAIENGVA